MKTLQYWGTGNFQEHPYTGRIVTWTEKEKQTVDDAIATKLLAANAGFVLDNDESGEVVTSQINSVTGRIEGLRTGDSSVSLDFKRRHNAPVILQAMMPTGVSGSFTGTHNLMMTAPGDFDAVAAVAINYDTSAVMTIDNTAVAVSERSDTSKTVPIINGTNYNALAGANDQLGFVPVTWNNGSTSVAVPVATLAASGSGKVQPTFAISDFIPLSSIPRVDDATKFPLVIVREYFNARTVSNFTFSTAADVDTLSTLMSPHEFYQTAQITVNGCTSPSTYTATWSAGANTQTGRILAMAFRLRGSGDFVLFTGDSIVQGCCANGDANANKPANNWSGFAAQAFKAISDKNRPVGYANISWTGTRSADYLELVKRAITTYRPSIAVYLVSTPNDSPNTTAAMSAEMARALDFIDTCEQNSVKPVLLVPVPYAGFTEATRLAFITKIKALRTVSVIDINAPVNDSTNSGQNYWTSAAYFDGTHPSAAGHTAIAINVMTPALRALVNN